MLPPPGLLADAVQRTGSQVVAQFAGYRDPTSLCRVLVRRPRCVRCFAASNLKNSMLFLLNARVTFTPSSRKANSAGDGRKSCTTLTLPNGSSVYLILAFIDCPSSAPISGADDAHWPRGHIGSM